MTSDLARDLYSLKMNNGLPLGLEHHQTQPMHGNDSVDYRTGSRKNKKIFWSKLVILVGNFFFESKKSLNSNFANVQIDLDNLAQVLGSTSIQVGSKSGQTSGHTPSQNSSKTMLPDDDRDCESAISAAKNDCHTHCSASPTVSPLPDHSSDSLPVFNVVTPPPKVPSMTSSVNSSPIGLQNRNSLTIGSDDYYWPVRWTLQKIRQKIKLPGNRQ